MRFIDQSPMYYNHSYFWAGGLLSIIVNVLLWGAIIWLIIKLIKHIAGGNSHSCCSGQGTCCMNNEEDQEDSTSYLDIAKMRYAKGEIDKKHYDELKKEFTPQYEEQKTVQEEEKEVKE